MTTPLVSVLMPAKGELKYIDYALASISNSTLMPNEVIVVNDGIDDNSLMKIKKFEKELKIKIIKNSGVGLVEALNTGISSCTSDYIARLDSDDAMVPNRLDAQLSFLENHDEIIVLGSQCLYIDEKNNEIGKSSYPIGDISTHRLFHKVCLVCHPSTMFRTSSAKIVGGYRSLFRWNENDIAEDFDFWLRLSSLGLVWNSNEPLTFYRQHRYQVSTVSNLGQTLGTPYIAAVNNLKLKSPKSIFFEGAYSENRKIYLTSINKLYGKLFSYYAKIIILVTMFNLDTSRFVRPIVRILVSKVSRAQLR